MTFRAYAAAILAVLPKGAREVSILAGGALRAYYDSTTVKDYDLFYRNPEHLRRAALALAENGFQFIRAVGGSAVWLSPCGREFNLVSLVFGEPEDHVGRFDFRCCQFAAYYVFNAGGIRGATALRTLKVNQARVDCRKKRIKLQNNNGTERTAKRIEHYENDYGYSLMGIKLSPNARSRRIRRYVARRPISGTGHES
ncbi:hypothetical protein [Lysobacter capsici]|uniref:hypothetical protein n=1 Tax=Lysobacter capsici TaxID=435897 RepID=UPI001BFFF611|nr:hypothetical protein [Lysobacter capsici]QWF18717.1 hypothetical protein KME82_08235 [Lysobacter capsici]